MSHLLVDADAIRALAELLGETGLSEIEIAEKENRIRVARVLTNVSQVATSGLPSVVPPPASAPTAVVPVDLASKPGSIVSPMVGIVYLTPEPSAPPYVVEGQTVLAGQTLMLIEAMKTFNQIKAPRAGIVKEILIQSGNPVEFGEVLAIIE